MIKTSDKLYELNAYLSLNYIGLRKKMTYRKIVDLNRQLGIIIKEIRELEDDSRNQERR